MDATDIDNFIRLLTIYFEWPSYYNKAQIESRMHNLTDFNYKFNLNTLQKNVLKDLEPCIKT